MQQTLHLYTVHDTYRPLVGFVNDGHKQSPWWPEKRFLKEGMTVNSLWICRFHKSVPLVFHTFIAVAIMVYPVVVMVWAPTAPVNHTETKPRRNAICCEQFIIALTYQSQRGKHHSCLGMEEGYTCVNRCILSHSAFAVYNTKQHWLYY